MVFSTRRVLVFIVLLAALFVLTTASGLAGQFRGSTEPARSAGWTWDDSPVE
jgi:putative Ca2+/H+ antiporter (TMEM165/GDT1 family)